MATAAERAKRYRERKKAGRGLSLAEQVAVLQTAVRQLQDEVDRLKAGRQAVAPKREVPFTVNPAMQALLDKVPPRSVAPPVQGPPPAFVPPFGEWEAA